MGRERDYATILCSAASAKLETSGIVAGQRTLESSSTSPSAPPRSRRMKHSAPPPPSKKPEPPSTPPPLFRPRPPSKPSGFVPRSLENGSERGRGRNEELTKDQDTGRHPVAPPRAKKMRSPRVTDGGAETARETALVPWRCQSQTGEMLPDSAPQAQCPLVAAEGSSHGQRETVALQCTCLTNRLPR